MMRPTRSKHGMPKGWPIGLSDVSNEQAQLTVTQKYVSHSVWVVRGKAVGERGRKSEQCKTDSF